MIYDILTTHKKEIEKAILIRLVEERLLSLFSEGALNGTVHTAVGQEFTGVFISKYLQPSDFVTSNHRGHGHYLARFGNVRGLISEIMGKDEGVSGGFGGSQHIVDENYFSNGIQGGMLPVAAGVSFYHKKIACIYVKCNENENKNKNDTVGLMKGREKEGSYHLW